MWRTKFKFKLQIKFKKIKDTQVLKWCLQFKSIKGKICLPSQYLQCTSFTCMLNINILLWASLSVQLFQIMIINITKWTSRHCCGLVVEEWKWQFWVPSPSSLQFCCAYVWQLSSCAQCSQWNKTCKWVKQLVSRPQVRVCWSAIARSTDTTIVCDLKINDSVDGQVVPISGIIGLECSNEAPCK